MIGVPKTELLEYTFVTVIMYFSTNSTIDIKFIALLIVIAPIFVKQLYVLRMSECSNQSGIELGYSGSPTETLRDFQTKSGISLLF